MLNGLILNSSFGPISTRTVTSAYSAFTSKYFEPFTSLLQTARQPVGILYVGTTLQATTGKVGLVLGVVFRRRIFQVGARVPNHFTKS